MVTKVYHTSSTSKYEANFTTIPFNNLSIEFNGDKASIAKFDSVKKLNEGDKIRIVGDNHPDLGGTVVKIGSKLRDADNSYDCIDYTRLFHGKTNLTTNPNKTSYEILKSMLTSLGYSTAGLGATKTKHKQLIWKDTTRWDIIQQLLWLDYKAGQYIECYVNPDGTLIYRPMPATHEGYVFKSAYDYNQDYDASKIESSKSEFKASIQLPMLKKLRPNQYCELQLEKFKNNRQKQYWIDSVKIDINKQVMTAELLENIPEQGMEYKEQNNSSNSSSKLGEIKADTAVERTIMTKGRELGSFNKIFNWLKVRGSGGWKYVYYYNHWQNKGSCYSKDTAAMSTCWSKKKANCTDFAWILYTMCKGINVDIEILNGSARFGSKIIGHVFNRYQGRIRDASSTTATNYSITRKIK